MDLLWSIISGNIVRSVKELEPTIATEMDGHPVLYVTRVNSTGDVYVNNAKIIRTSSDKTYKSKSGENRQVNLKRIFLKFKRNLILNNFNF